MKQKTKLMMVVLAFMALIVLMTGAVMADEGDTPQTIDELSAEQIAKNPDHASVVAGLDSIGSARLIIRVKTSSPFSGINGPDAAAQKALITSAQADFIATFPALAADMVAFRTIPYVSVWVRSEADYAGLLASSIVVSVRHDIPKGLDAEVIAPPTMTEANSWIDSNVFWAAGYDGDGYAVAVLDTGIDSGHDFLDDGKVVAEFCHSTNDTDYDATSLCVAAAAADAGTGSALPYAGNCPAGGCDHGTHVAGIAAGNDLGATGFSGVAPQASVISAQVFTRFETETWCGAGRAPCVMSFDTDQMSAMEDVYELTQGTNAAYPGVTLDVISLNMSLGGGRSYDHCDDEETARKLLIDQLKGVGVATVISAGNSGFTDSTGYPGCISTAFTVSATYDNSDTIASFSNAAPDITDVWAPGVGIISSIPTASGAGTNPTESYNGTSMSAPIVAGGFAILKDAYPTYTIDELWTVMETHGVMVTDTRTATDPTIAPRIDFTTALPGAAPAAPVLINPAHASFMMNTKPMFHWADTINATKYTVEVKDVATNTTAFKTTYSDAARCDGSVCSIPSPATLSPGTRYKWHVVGYNDTVKGVWSKWQTFTVGTSGLDMPVLNSPRGNQALYDSRPTLNWDQVAGANRYNLQLFAPDGSITLYNTTGVCAAGVCEFRLPSADDLGTDFGTYRWHAQAINTSTNEMSEYPGRVSFVYTQVGNSATVSPIGGATETVTRPTLTWSEADGSTAHLVQVYQAGGSMMYEFLYKNSNFCTAGVCNGQIFTHLADGDYTWRVRGNAGSNFGQWTADESFTVSSGGVTWTYPFTDNANGWVDVQGLWDIAESDYYRGDAYSAICSYGCATTFHNYRVGSAIFEADIASTGADGYDGFTFLLFTQYSGDVLQQALTIDWYGDPDNLYMVLYAYTAEFGWEYWGYIDFSGLDIDIADQHNYKVDIAIDRYDAVEGRYEEIYWIIDDGWYVTIFDTDFYEGSFGIDVIAWTGESDHLVDIDFASVSVVSGPSMMLPEGYFGAPAVNGLFGMSGFDRNFRTNAVDRSDEFLFEFGIWE
jgi:hypothetical protein